MLVYAVADPIYRKLYGDALINSGRAHGHDVEIFVSDKRAGNDTEKMFYCTWRFTILPDLLRKHGAALMLDVDSIIRSPISFEPETDVGIFLRPDMPKRDMKTLCTVFYCTDRAMEFAELMAAKCADHRGLAWCGEQALLWDTYEALGSKYRIQNLGQSFVDWRHTTKAPIFTGKGPVKLDRQYKKETQKWSERV